MTCPFSINYLPSSAEQHDPESDPDFPLDLVGQEDSEDSKLATFAWLLMHERRFVRADIPKITCTCRKRVSLDKSFRCRICGVWFCSDCSLNHFGLYVDHEMKVRKESVFSKFMKWMFG